MLELEQEIHKIAGRPFNVGSPKQLGEILFDEQNLPCGKRNKNGSWATDVSILEDLRGPGSCAAGQDHGASADSKLKGYLHGTRWCASSTPSTGRVHTSYQMTGAATGRLASTDPTCRTSRCAPRRAARSDRLSSPSRATSCCRPTTRRSSSGLLAHVADRASLKEAFARGDDIHAITASEMFGVPVKGMDPLVRRRAKAINFGIIYGISAFGLANQLGIGQQEAREYIAKYFLRYPGIRDYMEDHQGVRAQARLREDAVRPQIHLRYINEKAQGMRAFAERAAINAPLQGGAADIIKRAMIRLPAALKAARLKGRRLMQVHDELLFEVPDRGNRQDQGRGPQVMGRRRHAFGAAGRRHRRRRQLGVGALGNVGGT